MASAIKEGFICAECHAQFNSGNVLLAHYQEAHSPDESKSIKGLIEKARSRLVNKDRQEEALRLPPKYYDLYEDASPGHSNSHFEYFKRIRAAQVERYSSEASKLLIRLHKVLSFTGEEGKRRGHEQELVQWVDEKHVQRCPDCTQSFNLLLRKHHCRLCGSILCEHCSMFINNDLGATLTSSLGTGVHSTLSIEYKLRTCNYCYKLVNKKHIHSYSAPIISQFYDKLKSLMRQCETMNNEYSTMVSSLARGENLYSLEQCTAIRNELIKLTEKIDILSKRIILLGIETNEVISESEKKLRARLRLGAINWIRDFLSSLMTVPGKDKEPQGLGDGWTPTPVDNSSVSDSDDVLGIQIANMKKWINEAKKAKKFDEVEMLQANLTELLSFRNN